MKVGKYLPSVAAILVAASGYAQASEAGQPVEFVISAFGTSAAKADFMTVTVPIVSSGATTAQTRADNAAKIAKVRSALSSAGIGASATKIVFPRGPFGFVGNESYEGGVAPSLASLPSAAHATTMLSIEVAAPAQMEALSRILDDMDLKMSGPPVASLRDEKPQVRLAITDAVAEAKWQAEAYAQALNVRIAGIKKVENGCANPGAAAYGSGLSTWWTKIAQGASREDQWSVETNATICVTYLATP